MVYVLNIREKVNLIYFKNNRLHPELKKKQQMVVEVFALLLFFLCLSLAKLKVDNFL
jgi:hypothetical protein